MTKQQKIDQFDAGTTREIAANLASGMIQLDSLKTLDARLKQLGYRRDLSSRTPCRAKNLTTGNTYDNVNWTVVEIDTGRSAFHVDSRRDANFQALQAFRMWHFVVAKGSIAHV